MKSLQAPCKITIEGSDGKDYFFLCKPKDDLRKDARMMEMNNVISYLLAKDPEARKRRLRILDLSSDLCITMYIHECDISLTKKKND
jgi:phosphatidylinositol kinase/protein kinase (PI-3  family)